VLWPAAVQWPAAIYEQVHLFTDGFGAVRSWVSDVLRVGKCILLFQRAGVCINSFEIVCFCSSWFECVLICLSGYKFIQLSVKDVETPMIDCNCQHPRHIDVWFSKV